MARFGTALIVLGVLVLGYAGLWQLGLAPGSRVTLPPPVALSTPRPIAPTPTLVAAAPPTAVTVLPPTPIVGAPTPIADAPTTPAPLSSSVVADAESVAPPAAFVPRPQEVDPGGYAVRLAIPAINLDTPVQQGGTITNDRDEPEWETLPFVAVHYGDLTARVGARGNAVIAGHVVTLQEGNVFRHLYQLDFDDAIETWDDHDIKRDFRVVDVRLVPPTDVSVMAPTDDTTLTLITCGGTFDPIKREFSDRLIVTAKPL
jgi:LPXTG-site transpeptidase (sortase) family protein